MVAYATLEEFVSYFSEEETSELCNYADPNMSAERTRVNQALESATGEINTLIGGRFAVPFIVVVPYLRDACCIIARKNLYSTEETDTVRNQYNDVIKRLTDLAKGNGILIDESGNEVPDKETVTPTQQYSRTVVGNRGATIPNFGQRIDNPFWW